MQRLQELANETPGQLGVLRLMVEGGGCSGYTYLFSLESAVKAEDKCVLSHIHTHQTLHYKVPRSVLNNAAS